MNENQSKENGVNYLKILIISICVTFPLAILTFILDKCGYTSIAILPNIVGTICIVAYLICNKDIEKCNFFRCVITIKEKIYILFISCLCCISILNMFDWNNFKFEWDKVESYILFYLDSILIGILFITVGDRINEIKQIKKD